MPLFTYLFSSLLLIAACTVSQADVLLRGESEGQRYKVEQVTEGLGITWGMAFLSPRQIIFTQRSGQIGLYSLVTDKQTLLAGVPEVHASGQGGMLDVALPPGYKPGGWIYFTYSKPVEGEGATTLARARLKDSRLIDWQDLRVTKSTTDTDYHYGSRIAFDGQGHVFFGIGDRGVRPNSQNLHNHAGAVLRLTLDGAIPQDNPFADSPGALPEIWSYGHRNPQGLVFDRKLNRLWEMEHGPRGGDELNLVEKGKNYGWPVISYGKEYWGPVAVGEGTAKPGMEQPVKVYVPSIAPGSLMLYTGKAFPQWQGNLFAGALKLRHLNRVALDANGNEAKEERLLGALKERIRSLAQSLEGWIYLATDSGRLLRLQPE